MNFKFFIHLKSLLPYTIAAHSRSRRHIFLTTHNADKGQFRKLSHNNKTAGLEYRSRNLKKRILRLPNEEQVTLARDEALLDPITRLKLETIVEVWICI